LIIEIKVVRIRQLLSQGVKLKLHREDMCNEILSYHCVICSVSF